MKILALDTATKSCSVALTDNGSLSAELTTLKDQTHSKHLMELIHSVFEIAGFGVRDVDGFAVTIGPGSFTGLRIGISTIKGLAHAVGKPVVGISSLKALAWQCDDQNHSIYPFLDARKGEVYWATYRFEGVRLVQKSPARATAPEAALDHIKNPCVFIGNGAQLYRQQITTKLGYLAHFAPKDKDILRASSIAFLSIERFNARDTDEVADLIPQYIRKSDAELKFDN
ncbi:MAG: tRNA (adenosine(37)-N6)-threonylcarbamoyltransferase complex dimerization subunit type 1 TsaB, partial [Desulfobacterales bacterium]